MAATESFDGRAAGKLIAWLAVPRVVTFIFVVALGVGLGELASRFINKDEIFAWLSGMAAPFCMICATAVWSMRDRVDDLIDTEALTSGEYSSFAILVAKHRARATFWAAVAAVMALTASGPAVASQLLGTVPHWMVLGCGGAVGGAISCYLLANHWESQIRDYKTRQRLLSKRQREKLALMSEISAGAATKSEPSWIAGPPLNTPTRHPN